MGVWLSGLIRYLSDRMYKCRLMHHNVKCHVLVSSRVDVVCGCVWSKYEDTDIWTTN